MNPACVRLHSAAGMAGGRTPPNAAAPGGAGAPAGGDPVASCVAGRELRRALPGPAGLHSILDVQIDGTGKTHASILKEYQVDKVRGHVTHVDLQEVPLDQAIHASVSVHLLGGEDAPGVREGGVLSQPLRGVNVEALP